jgi:hemoglobin/transferrin/lactoferrin receptor protein
MYYTLLNNYITRDYFEVNNASTIMYDGEEGTVVANVNKDTAYILGSTFSFKGNINDTWYTKGSLTYTKGKTYDTKQPLSSIPPLFGNLEIGFEKDRFQANLNWRFNAEKRIEDYNLIEGIDNVEQTPYNAETDSYYGNPKWNTFGLNTNYKVTNNLTLFVNLDNIFDIHYKEFASSISAPGRNISISANLTI